jgi:hypothetical protein
MPVATPLKLGTYAPPTTRCVSFHSEVSRLLSLRPTLLFSARNFCTFTWVLWGVQSWMDLHTWSWDFARRVWFNRCSTSPECTHKHTNNCSDFSNQNIDVKCRLYRTDNICAVERSLGVGADGNPGNSRTFLVPRDTVSQTGLGQECFGTVNLNAMGVGGMTWELAGWP